MRSSWVLAGVLVLSGCAGGAGAAAGSTPAPCPPVCPGSPPPAPSPSGTDPPEGSAAWDALVVEPQDGELARGGNDADATVQTATFAVVVPAGQRLRTRAVCQGRTSVTVTTDPPTAAAAQLPCTLDQPSEVVVQEPVPHGAATPVTVTVQAPAPARWYVVVSATP